ncbi:MAG TPA: topoisomerase C-terminal repeat-containing protein, partial [Chloroflexota bacterium]
AARAAAAPPLKELGDDSASGKPMVVREGRFGPYVTDGETNASLRKGDTVESITPQRAIELLAERRSAAPAPKRKPGTRTTKPAASKTAASKTAAAKPKAAAKSGTKTRVTKKAAAEDGHDS